MLPHPGDQGLGEGQNPPFDLKWGQQQASAIECAEGQSTLQVQVVLDRYQIPTGMGFRGSFSFIRASRCLWNSETKASALSEK